MPSLLGRKECRGGERIDYQELWDSEKAFLRHIRWEEFQVYSPPWICATKSPGS